MRKSQITSLPLNKEDRAEFIETANQVFEAVLERMEPQNPEAIRKLWDAEHYVDNALLQQDMLPIDRSYALSLIDAFLVHHVMGLASQAGPSANKDPIKDLMNDPDLMKDVVDSILMEEHDPSIQRGLTCHVEINIESNATHEDIVAEVARGLRTTAVQMEAGKLDEGFHPIKTLSGEKIGEVYLDYYVTETL